MGAKTLLKTAFGVVSVLMLSAQVHLASAASNCVLWTTAQTTTWSQQAYGVGNGWTGAIIWGTVASEKVGFTNGTLYKNAGSQGEQLGYKVNLGFLNIAVTGTAGFTAYNRQLDIGEGIQTTTFTAGGKNFTREFFCSYPDSIFVGHFKTNAATSITLDVSWTASTEWSNTSVTSSGNTILITGSTTLAGFANQNAEVQVYCRNYGGNVTASNGHVFVNNADSADIYVATGTDYLQSFTANWHGGVPHTSVTGNINGAVSKGYGTLKTNHLNDFRTLFNKFTLDLNDPPSKNTETATRVNNYVFSSGNDRGLDVLAIQMGRYIIMCASREGPNHLPATLQGIWQPDNGVPAWSDNYHNDLNVEMAYYHVESLNLQECFMPFYHWINSIRVPAHNQNPQWRGWCVSDNHMGAVATSWRENNIACNGWLLRNLWDHFEYSQDRTYLAQILPIVKEECQFWQDNSSMYNGKLEANYNTSPELGEKGPHYGAAIDQQFMYDMFTNYSYAESILNQDPNYKRQVDSMKAILDDGQRVGAWGQIQEWLGEYDNNPETHRHCAHMMAVHPCAAISPLINTAKANAAKVSMVARGDGSGQSWATAERSLIWARLLDSSKAYRHFSQGIDYRYNGNLLSCEGGTFQIDGNCGLAAAAGEMLAQNHVGYKICLLPALPKQWPQGTVRGLRLRNGFLISTMSWNNNVLTQAYIKSNLGNQCLLYGTNYCVADSVTGNTIPTTISSGCLQFNTTTNTTYRITPGTCVTGVEETGFLNPGAIGYAIHITSNGLWLEGLKDGSEYTLKLFDSRGRLIKEVAHVSGSDVRVSTKRLPRGLYLAQLESRGERLVSRKVLIP
jgi:alpha-L-fucosidase 2